MQQSVVRRSFVVSTLVVLALAPGRSAAAQDSTRSTPRRDSLEAVVIRATRAGASAPTSRTVIDRATIERTYAGQDAPLALQGATGVTAASDAGAFSGYSSIRLRGIDQTRLAISVDGVPLNDPEDQVLYFANFADQRLYRHLPGEEPRPITPEPPLPAGLRYADFTFGNGFLVGVRERHGEGEAVNELVRLPLDGSEEPQVIASGHDFFASPRLSPDGRSLCWLTWDHPDMPWNGTTLWLAEVDQRGMPGATRVVAGGRGEAIFQPEWSPDGRLHFASDRSGSP